MSSKLKAGVILKTVERCNINCTYCYYFNKSDQSWRNRKPYISKEMVSIFTSFVARGVIELNISDLLIEFHGGEPLMQKKEDFVFMVEQILSSCEKLSLNSLKFAL